MLFIVGGLVVAGIVVAGIFSDSKQATSLEAGDCILEPDGEEFSSVTTIDCAEPHDYEIIGTATISSGSDVYPGDDQVLTLAQEACLPLFESYVGTAYADSIWWLGNVHTRRRFVE